MKFGAGAVCGTEQYFMIPSTLFVYNSCYCVINRANLK